MPDRPNILLITSHDLGRHLGCYGQNTVVSPHLDRLASQGVRFANSFCVAPQCSPSRAAIATGRYPHSNGVMGLTHADFAWELNADEVHVAQRLRDAGYHTVLGSFQHESGRPNEALGFVEALGRGGGAPKVAEQTCDYLRAYDDSKPLYLQLAFFEPHRTKGGWFHEPCTEQGVAVPQHLVDDDSARGDFAGYQGDIKVLDEAVGRVMQTLDETGMADDTLVLFAADHGMPFPRAKCSVYDPGLEVALIVRWPKGGFVASGSVLDPMIPNVDYLPTILELLGLEVDERIQGRSFAPLLRGQTYQPHDCIFAEMTYHAYFDPMRCIRTPTHKLILFMSTNPALMDPSQGWRPKTITKVPPDPAFAFHPLLELYDLQADPLETTNLADDLAHAAVRDALLSQLAGFMRDTNDPLLHGAPINPTHRIAIDRLTRAMP